MDLLPKKKNFLVFFFPFDVFPRGKREELLPKKGEGFLFFFSPAPKLRGCKQ